MYLLVVCTLYGRFPVFDHEESCFPSGPDVTLQLQAAKECHCERSEAISRLWGLLSRVTRDNDKSTPLLSEGLRPEVFSRCMYR